MTPAGPHAEHPDAVDRLRLALWGAADAATTSAQDHAAGCAACAADVASYVRVRNLMREACGGSAPPSALAAARASLRGASGVAETEAEPLDFTWLTAAPVGSFAGVRSGGLADRLLRCTDGDLQLDVCVQPGEDARHVTLSGQVLRDDDAGADLEVTLFLDRRPAGTVRTDRFGEFSVSAPRAGRVGVRVAGAGPARHVELWTGDASR